MKLKEKNKAIRLRRLGKSYKEILKDIMVSKGTLSLWLRDIKLTPKQQERIYVELRQKNAYRMAKSNQEKRIKRTKEVVGRARKIFRSYHKDPLFLAGLMLYWAEGDKANESVKFSNSDPLMIRLMMGWFRKICMVPENKFRICLHIHKLHCRKDIQNYWSGLTGVPLSQFYKTQVKPTSLGQRKNKLYNGTCAVSVCSRDLFRTIGGWKLAFLEKMDIK
jgi:hypothetical protein